MSDDLTKEIQILLRVDGKDQTIKSLQLTGAETTKLIEAVKKLNSTQPVSKEQIAGLGSMNNAVLELGYTLSDSAMFLTSFRMGMMSIGNNLPMIVQGFMQSKQAAEAAGQSISGSFVQSLKGTGGVMLAVSAADLALEVLAKAFTSTAAEESKATKEAKDFAKELKNMDFTDLEDKLAELRNRFEETKKAGLSGVAGNAIRNAFSQIMTGSPLTYEANHAANYEFTEEQVKFLKQAKSVDDAINKVGLLPSLKWYKKLAEDKQNEAKSAAEVLRWQLEINKYQDRIDELTKDKDKKDAQKQAILTKLSEGGGLSDEEKKQMDLLTWAENARNKFAGNQAVLTQIDKYVADESHKIWADYRAKEQAEWEKSYDERKELDSEYLDFLRSVTGSESPDLRPNMNEINITSDMRIRSAAEVLQQRDSDTNHDRDVRRALDQQRRDWEEEHQIASGAINSITGGFQQAWSQWVIGSRQAKNGMDAVWLSMRNSFLRTLEQMITDYFTKMAIIGSMKVLGSALGIGLGAAAAGSTGTTFLYGPAPTSAALQKSWIDTVMPESAQKLNQIAKANQSVAPAVYVQGKLDVDLYKLSVKMENVKNTMGRIS